MPQKLNIDRIWWRNVPVGEFYNVERHPNVTQGGQGSLYFEIPSSMVPQTLDFLGLRSVESLPHIIQAGVIGQDGVVSQDGVSGPIEFQAKSGGRMRIVRQNRQMTGAQRHPAWTAARGFPSVPGDVRNREEARRFFPDGGLRIYIARTVEGHYYAGFTTGPRPSGVARDSLMWDLYAQGPVVGGVLDTGLSVARSPLGDGPDQQGFSGEAEVGEPSLLLANVSNDLAHSHDHIGVSDDARALAALLVSRTLKPPLALGLYGAWGSGKTFFMNRIEENVDQLANSEEGREAFHQKVGHIWFNAWHYAEGNLWASLLHHIFTTLAGTADAAEDALLAAVAEVEGAREFTEAADARLSAASERLKLALQKVKDAEERKSAAVTAAGALKGRDLWETAVVSTDDQLARRVQAAAKQMGLPEVGASARDLWAGASEVAALGRRTRVLATSGKNWWNSPLVLAGGAFVLGGGSLLWLASATGVSDTVASVAGPVAAVGASIAAWVGRQSALAKDLLAPAERLQRQLEERKAVAESEFEVALALHREELRATEAELIAAEEVLRSAQGEEAAARAEKRSLTGSRLLQRFLEARAGSADYRQYLGVVELARRDLNDLQSYLDAALRDAAAERHLERIVLYIDDLDRCAPDRVAEVLDAIHLMLAQPLFVVVVGVSPDWLERSLEKRHRDLLAGGEAGQVTPADYLEKIFQLTYSLRPLDGASAGDLIVGLAGASAESEVSTADDVHVIDVGPLDLPARPVEDIEGAVKAVKVEAPGTVQALAASLVLSQSEIGRLRDVAVLVSNSPRRVQRFLNLYLVLKARGFDGQGLLKSDGLVVAAALAVGMPVALARVLESLDLGAGEASLASALSEAVEEYGEEALRWSAFNSLEGDALDGLVAVDMSRWVEAIRPYLPLTFQAAVPSPERK